MQTKSHRPIQNFDVPAFSCGAQAIELSGGALGTSQSLEWILGTNHRYLSLAAIASLGIPQQSQIHVCYALPYHVYNKDSTLSKFKRQMAGHYTVKPERKPELSFGLAEVECHKQGTLAILNNVWPWGEHPRTAVLDSAFLIDAGGHTCEFFAYRQKRLLKNLSDSDETLGAKSIANMLKTRLAEEGIALSEARCMEAVITQRLRYNRQDIPWFPAFLAEQNERLVDNIVTKATAGDRLGEMEYLLLTGGYGQDIYPLLKQRIEGLHLSETPLYDNALGALKYAMRGGASPHLVYVGLDVGFQNVKAVSLDQYGILHTVCFPSVVGQHIYTERISL